MTKLPRGAQVEQTRNGPASRRAVCIDVVMDGLLLGKHDDFDRDDPTHVTATTGISRHHQPERSPIACERSAILFPGEVDRDVAEVGL